MTFIVRTGFDKKHRCETFSKVTLTAVQALECIQANLLDGCSYAFGTAFAEKYDSVPIPVKISPYLKRAKAKTCTRRR